MPRTVTTTRRPAGSALVRDADALLTRTSPRAVTINISQKGGTLTLNSSNTSALKVTIAEDAQSWISYKKTIANGARVTILSFSANNTLFKRTGKVVISTGTGIRARSVKLSIAQDIHPNVSKVQKVMEEFYEALDGRNWAKPWIPGETLPGVKFLDPGTFKELYLDFYFPGLKGRIPESIGELGGLVQGFDVQNEPGIVGQLPSSFSKFVNLKYLSVYKTGLTFVPDFFGSLKNLQELQFACNEQLACPLYESMGSSSKLVALNVSSNLITGTPPASWARLGRRLRLYNDCLSGSIPQSYLDSPDARYILAELLYQRKGYGFDVSGIEVPSLSCWSEETITDFNGRSFTMDEIVRKNRCTLHYFWHPDAEYSLEQMQQFKAFYDKYHQDGFEVMATITTGKKGLWDDKDTQAQKLGEIGCTQWYNYFYPDAGLGHYYGFCPIAEVYDQEGNILFSTAEDFEDPVRRRTGRYCTELIPFLGGIFGPV